MTSDAKVGLLLSFVFIIIIAFLLKGLPDFFQSASAQEEFSTSIDGSDPGESDLTGRAEAVVKAINSTKPPYQQEQTGQPVQTAPKVRFRRELPIKTASAGAALENQHIGSEQSKDRASSYVVQPGDNLALIAIKVYGERQGNKRTVVNKIFEANMDILDSPHQIAIGQKLKMPSLSPTGQKPDRKKVIAATGITDRLKEFADRNLSALMSAIGNPDEYVIRPGDNLWNIAERFLDDGGRYHEIVKLNSNVIDDAENIQVGTRLRLPSR